MDRDNALIYFHYFFIIHSLSYIFCTLPPHFIDLSSFPLHIFTSYCSFLLVFPQIFLPLNIFPRNSLEALTMFPNAFPLIFQEHFPQFSLPWKIFFSQVQYLVKFSHYYIYIYIYICQSAKCCRILRTVDI